MVQYKCPRCGYSTHKMSNIKHHIDKGRTCGDKLSDIIPTIDNIIRENKTREELVAEVAILTREIEILKSKLTPGRSPAQSSALTTSTQIGTIDNINTGHPKPFYKTSLDHLTDKDFKYCVGRMIMAIPCLIKKIHFNPKHPENHNIRISNIKGTYGMTFDGNRWNLCDRNVLIEDLIDKYEYKLEEWIRHSDREHPVEMEMFGEYLEKKELDGVVDKIKEEIKLTLYNNRAP